MRWPPVSAASQCHWHALTVKSQPYRTPSNSSPDPIFYVSLHVCQNNMICPRNPVFESTVGVRLRCQRDPRRYFGASAGFLDLTFSSFIRRKHGDENTSAVAEIWGIHVSRRTDYDALPGASNFAWTSLNLWSEGLGSPSFHFRRPHP
jgi:hypothetical protein